MLRYRSAIVAVALAASRSAHGQSLPTNPEPVVPSLHSTAEIDDPAEASKDSRGRLEASIFVGLGIDNFAAGEVNKYLNPEDSSTIRNRWVGGFGIDYLFKETRGGQRFWISLQTIHGVRSADVDCEKSPETSVCKSFTDVTSAGERTIYILRNASSLEGAGSLRWELFDWADTQRRPNATFYLVGRLGFLTVSDSGGDVIDNHRIGVGTVAIEGPFVGSFLEASFGRSDLFVDNSDKRWKLDGLLLFDLPKPLSGVRGFARMVVDVDFGEGSDSIQSYLGLALPVERLFDGARR